MKNNIQIALIVIFIIATFTEYAKSQVDKSSYYYRGNKFYYNYFYQPVDKGDSLKVYTIYKIAYDLLKFTKLDENDLQERYVAYPEFEVHFQDEEGIIRKRDKRRDTIIVNDYKLINRVDIFYYGSVVSKLGYHEYTPYVYLWDEDMVKLGEKKLPQLDLTKMAASVGVSSPLISYASDESDTANIYPYILDRNASFSSKDILFYFLSFKNNPDLKYFSSIEFLDAGRTAISWTGPSRINVEPEIINNKVVKFINKKHEEPVFKIIDGEPNDFGYKNIVKIRFTADRTAPGNYLLRVWNNQNKDTVEFKFKIIWENIPISLRKPKYAAEIMYYVLTDDEYDEIKSGSDREILSKIFKWWQKQDPTPFTLYNEAMTEYFRRVDYAFFNFKTIFEKDGAKSDRGKIYILYGAPDKVDTSMDTSGKTTEVWTYNKLKKKFYFLTDKNGIIYLKEIKNF